MLLILLLKLTSEDSNDGVSQALQLCECVSNLRALQPAKLLAECAQKQDQHNKNI